MLRLIRTDQEGNTMRITIDIDTDKAVLLAIAGGTSAVADDAYRAIASGGTLPEPVKVPEPVKAPVKAPAKAPVKAAQAKEQAPEPEVAPSATETTEAEPEVTPEPEAKPEPTKASAEVADMEALVKRAAELISSGERARVKVALEAVGAGRVSKVTPEQAAAFIAALG